MVFQVGSLPVVKKVQRPIDLIRNEKTSASCDASTQDIWPRFNLMRLFPISFSLVLRVQRAAETEHPAHSADLLN
jgi:hypothetical protein